MLVVLGLGQKTAVLRLTDVVNEEILIKLDAGVYKIYFFSSHFETDPLINYCFRLRTVQTGKNNRCTLEGLFNNYRCLEIKAQLSSTGSLTGVTGNTWTSDHTLTSTARTGLTAIPSNLIANASTTTNGTSSNQITVTIDAAYLTLNAIY